MEEKVGADAVALTCLGAVLSIVGGLIESILFYFIQEFLKSRHSPNPNPLEPTNQDSDKPTWIDSKRITPDDIYTYLAIGLVSSIGSVFSSCAVCLLAYAALNVQSINGALTLLANLPAAFVGVALALSVDVFYISRSYTRSARLLLAFVLGIVGGGFWGCVWIAVLPTLIFGVMAQVGQKTTLSSYGDQQSS